MEEVLFKIIRPIYPWILQSIFLNRVFNKSDRSYKSSYFELNQKRFRLWEQLQELNYQIMCGTNRNIFAMSHELRLLPVNMSSCLEASVSSSEVIFR
jgi:hypothetical protein